MLLNCGRNARWHHCCFRHRHYGACIFEREINAGTGCLSVHTQITQSTRGYTFNAQRLWQLERHDVLAESDVTNHTVRRQFLARLKRAPKAILDRLTASQGRVNRVHGFAQVLVLTSKLTWKIKIRNVWTSTASPPLCAQKSHRPASQVLLAPAQACPGGVIPYSGAKREKDDLTNWVAGQSLSDC